jgi:NAD-dependent SIR2 family protein deacetylase
MSPSTQNCPLRHTLWQELGPRSTADGVNHHNDTGKMSDWPKSPIPLRQRRSSIITEPIAPDVAALASGAYSSALPQQVLDDLVRRGTPPIDMTVGEHGALQHSIDKLDTIDMETELSKNAAAADFAGAQAWKFDLDLGLGEEDVNPWAYSKVTNAVFKVTDFIANLAGAVLPNPSVEAHLVGPQPRHSISLPSSQASLPEDKVWVRRNIMGSFENTLEHHDDAAVLIEKVDSLVNLIKSSQYLVVFTGAGVSTGCGIPDYRGPKGVWTSRAKGLPEPVMPSPADVKPGVAHKCIMRLWEEGYIKFLITQNVDGLHLRSGLPSSHLAELHGNFNVERCSECPNRVYVKNSLKTYPSRSSEDHHVPRKCKKCGAAMRDSMVQFGEAMPRVPLHAATSHTQLADLFLVLGSSLSVYPAHTLPRHVTERGKELVIVNYQSTAFDDLANLRIFADTAEVLLAVCQGLGVHIGEGLDVEDALERDNAGDGWISTSQV